MKNKQSFSPSIQKWEALIPLLWCEVSEVIKLCLKDKEKNGKITIAADDSQILALYKGLDFNKKNILFDFDRKKGNTTDDLIPNPYLPYNLQTDRHLREGLYETQHWKRNNRYPRLVELTINACKVASKSENKAQRLVIPSPLHIIYSFLTDPENSCTAAYALTICRNWLSRILDVWPVINSDQHDHTQSKQIMFLSESELRSSMETFSSHLRIGMRWPGKVAINKSNASSMVMKHLFVGSYLTIRGFSFLWYGQSKKNSPFNMLPSRGQHDKVEQLAAQLLKNAHFLLSPNYKVLPPHDEISNQLFGFPLPIKGMDVVFNGGLRPSSSGGLVMVVSGQPGAGKTSFSLSLVNSLLPFGTPAYYISLEETVSDIHHKLDSIKPDFESRLCITLGNDELFNCAHFPAFSMNYKQFHDEMEKVLQPMLPSKDNKEPIIAGTCAGVIVIDNLNILNENSKGTDLKAVEYLEKIVARCREANLLTIFVTAKDLLSKLRLDYLADSVIDLRYDGLTKVNDRPVRIFNLLKSRHQLSRHGAHVFHMGSGKGFRIVPNMDSLIGRRSNIKLEMYDNEKLNHALNFSRDKLRDYLKIFSGTNILLQGYGSSGKAGLSLRLLLTPVISKKILLKNVSDNDFSSIKYRRKVLIVSFLYPNSYYDELVFGKRGKINCIYYQLKNIFPGVQKPVLEYLVLYPGFIGPQDLLNKIVTKLDEANLSGEPYTAVLIDGLHNVFLQYPRLQEADMVWAMLYNILRRYPLTVVSTFTNFSVSENIIPSIADDSHSNSNLRNPDGELMQKGMTPFLHALIKAADYYLVLQEVTCSDNSKLYPLAVRSAIGQSVPSNIALWNREQLLIEEYLTVTQLKKQINLDETPQE